MAFTRHGHQIEGTIAEARPPGMAVARCGGPRMCANCALDVQRAGLKKDPKAWREEVVAYNDETFARAKEVIASCGTTKSEASDIVAALTRAGILLREKLPYI